MSGKQYKVLDHQSSHLTEDNSGGDSFTVRYIGQTLAEHEERYDSEHEGFVFHNRPSVGLVVPVDDNGGRILFPLDVLEEVGKSEYVPGDVVSLEHPDGSRIVKRTVDPVYSIKVGRRREYVSDLLDAGFVLSEVVRPRPLPPTELGSVIRLDDGTVLFLQQKAVFFDDAMWTNRYSDMWTVADIQLSGFTVLHDEGEAL